VRVLDKDLVNYKAPESLDRLEVPAGDAEAAHKKFVWKFGLLVYQLIYKKLPFSFVEANSLNNRDSESLQITQETIKRFSHHITSRLELLKTQWNPHFDMINNLLRGALVRDYQRRTRYPDLRALFQDVFNFFQPTPPPQPKSAGPAPKTSLNPFVRAGHAGRRLRPPQLRKQTEPRPAEAAAVAAGQPGQGHAGRAAQVHGRHRLSRKKSSRRSRSNRT
jgi:hypothetical protein